MTRAPLLAVLLASSVLPGCETIFPGFALVEPPDKPPLPAVIDANAYLKAQAPDDPWIVPLLSEDDDLEIHLVKVTGRVEPHLHERSDETIYVLSGYGDLLVEREWRRIEAGMLVHVPRDVPHAYVNRAPEGTVALSVFTPRLLSGDRVPVPYDTEKPR